MNKANDLICPLPLHVHRSGASHRQLQAPQGLLQLSLGIIKRYQVLRIRSILDRIRPTDFRPDPDPACNITGCEKKFDNIPVFRKSTLNKDGGTKNGWVQSFQLF